MEKKSENQNNNINAKQTPLISKIKQNISNNKKISIFIEIVKHLSLIMLFFFFICTFNTNEMKNVYGEELFIKPNSKQYLKLELVKKFNDYLDICKQGELIDKKNIPY